MNFCCFVSKSKGRGIKYRTNHPPITPRQARIWLHHQAFMKDAILVHDITKLLNIKHIHTYILHIQKCSSSCALLSHAGWSLYRLHWRFSHVYFIKETTANKSRKSGRSFCKDVIMLCQTTIVKMMTYLIRDSCEWQLTYELTSNSGTTVLRSCIK